MFLTLPSYSVEVDLGLHVIVGSRETDRETDRDREKETDRELNERQRERGRQTAQRPGCQGNVGGEIQLS